MKCDMIPKAANGQPSYLFESIINSGLSREDSTELYYRVHQPEFKKAFGDWESTNLGDLVDHNNEPRLEYIMTTKEQLETAKNYHDVYLDEELSFDMPSIFEIQEEEPKYIDLLSDYNYRLRKVNEQLSFAKRNHDKKLQHDLEKQITSLTNAISDIEKARKLEDIQKFAERDLADVEKLLTKEDISLREIFLAKQKLHTWQKGIDLFFEEDEVLESSLTDVFKDYELQARHLENYLIKLEDANLVSMVKKTIHQDIDTKSLYELKKDVNKAVSETQDISKVNDLVFQAIHRLVKNKNSVTSKQIQDNSRRVDALSNKLKQKYGKDYSDKFLQKDKDGKHTGSIISKWSFDFLETKRSLKRAAFGDNSTPGKVKKYFAWKKENEIIMDPNLIYGEDLSAKEKHLSELEEHMGKSELERRFSMMDKKIETYKVDAEIVRDQLLTEIGGANAEISYSNWELDNSPFLYAARVKSKTTPVRKTDGTFPKNHGATYLYEIPRKFYSDGKETKWYDNRFSEIENDSDLLEFYNYYMDTMKEMTSVLPQDQLDNLRLNSIPGIKKTVLDMFERDGMKAGLGGIWDSLKKSLTVGETISYGKQYVDPVTGESPATLKIDSIENIDNKINLRVKEKTVTFTTLNERTPTAVELLKITQEARQEITNESITDLGRILKAYSALSITYKHKTEVEDYLQLSKALLNRQVEIETNSAGQPILDPKTNELRPKTIQDSYKNKKEMLDYYIDVQHGNAKAIEGVGEKKTYTTEEQKKKTELESKLAENKDSYEKGLISNVIYEKNENAFQKEIDKLGGYYAASSAADRALDLVRLKGMGWNPMSATANMLFGLVSNVIEGSDGRTYTAKSFWKGYTLTMNSVAKSLSFNTVQTPTAKKIRNLMDKFDVLKESSQELYATKRHEWEGKMKNVHPYNLQRITEYMNQAPIMIAIMLDTKVTVNGEEMNLWEAFDEDGNLKGFEVGETAFNDLKAKIDQIIKQNHGNYDIDSPFKLKQKIWGRALGQFRTFMFEGFEARFGNERFDANLGVQRKGRYKSYVSYFKKAGTIKGGLFMSQQLLRKMFFQRTQFDQLLGEDGFTEVDAANMRKNMTGLIVLAAVSCMYFVGKASVEDDEEKLAVYNWFTNQLLRVQTDMTFYANPASFEALTKQSIPAMSLVSDTSQLFYSIYKFMLNEDEIKSGVHSGNSRLIREAMQFTPGLKAMYNTYNSSKQVFDKN